MTEAKIDDLLNAANVVERSGLTVAGRALQKHGERLGSLFPKPKGNPQAINEQASTLVVGILTHSKRTITKRHHARFGNVVEIYAPNGQGIRYDSHNHFIGFIEKGE